MKTRIAWGVATVLAVAVLGGAGTLLTWMPPEKARAIAIAKRAVEAHGEQVNRVVYRAQRTTTGWWVTAEQKGGLFGLFHITGGTRFIRIDRQGKVTEYSPFREL
jgi:hypothetical protein